MKKLILVAIMVIAMVGCTDKQRAKSFGGKFTVDLPKGEKLIEATWKGENLWYLTTERDSLDPIRSYQFREDSSFGVIEGKVTFKEH